MRIVKGYDFSTDRDGGWFEGTAQAALAYKQAGSFAKYEEILEFLNDSALPDGSIPSADRKNVTAGFFVSGTDTPRTYGGRSHVGATVWLAFAQMRLHPFEIGE